MSTIKAEKLQSLGSKLNFLTGATPTQRLTIDENGNVGIGTVTPTAKLQTIDTNNAARFGANNVNSLTIGSRGGSPYSGIGYNVNFDSGADNLYFALGADRTSLIRFANGGFEFKGNATVGAVSGTPFALTDYMTILNSGNVGIGTVSPGVRLEVAGSIRPTGGTDLPAQVHSNAVLVGGAGTPDSGRLIIGDGSGWKYKISSRVGSVTTDLVTFDDRGMVGIGVAAPTVALDVAGEARSSTSTTSASNAKTLTTKDYVDTGGAFGSYSTLQTLSHVNNGTINTTSSTFFINKDSFLIVRGINSGSNAYQRVYVDTFSPPTNIRFTNSNAGSSVMTCPIAKNSYIIVTQSSSNNQSTTIEVMPIGS